MQFNRLKTRKGGLAAQAGYTITEVSVVLTVMGLVVGGVLKAQEMIENARITATLSQVQQIQAAVEQFQIKYNSLPGDFAQAQTYIAGGSILNGNGNGIIGQRDTVRPQPGSEAGVADNQGVAGGGCTVGSGSSSTNDSLEARQFWLQMSAAGLLKGVRPDSNADVAAKIGVIFPDSRMGSGGGWQIANCVVGGAATVGDNSGEQNHWLRLGAQGTGAGPVDAGANSNTEPAGLNNVGIATDYQAYQLDRRFDDGIPTMGAVRTISFLCGTGPTGPGTATVGTPQDTYQLLAPSNTSAQNNVTCVMYFRM